MNTNTTHPGLIAPLVAKDWQLVRGPIFAYAGIGVASLALLVMNSQLLFIIGSIVLLTVVIIIGAHLIMVTVVKERAQQTLPFVMSLPITQTQYTAAKLVANLGIYFVAWLAVLAAVIALIMTREGLPNGLVPYAVIVMTELAIAFALTLAVALISESEAWTVVVMSVGNVSVSIFMISVARIESIGRFIEGPAPVWNRTAVSFIAVELAIIAALVAFTFWAQARKRDLI